jgi:hypothetical protein
MYRRPGLCPRSGLSLRDSPPCPWRVPLFPFLVPRNSYNCLDTPCGCFCNWTRLVAVISTTGGGLPDLPAVASSALVESMALASVALFADRFQPKVLRKTVDASWYLPNTVIRRDLQTPVPSLQLSIQCAPQCTPRRPSSEPHGATRQQAIAKTPAKRSTYQTLKCKYLICSLLPNV